MNIIEMDNEEIAEVVSLEGGSSFLSRLTAMGVNKGRLVRKVSDSGGGNPVIIEVMGSKVAIGRKMAERIIVVVREKKLLLTGNPNVGKSVVFSRLTGLNVISSNYPGTTVEFCKGTARLGGTRFCVTDVPGAYSLASTCVAEDVACRILSEGQADIIIDVLDSVNLERNLFFALQLLEKGLPVILLLNKWDAARLKGITIDAEMLSRRLGTPVVPFVAVTGEGLKELNKTTAEFFGGKFGRPKPVPPGDDGKWRLIGELSREVQKITHKHPTFLEKLADISVVPLTGIPIALAVLASAFYAIRIIGEGLIRYFAEPLFSRIYLPLLNSIAGILWPCRFCRELLMGQGQDIMQSFGALTTGVYVPFVSVVPYIFSFYLVLGFLEDLGYLPRLAVLLDRSMHRLGLHGYGAIPLMLGMGCKVPAILAVRVLESRRERIIAIALTLLIVPCMPQTAGAGTDDIR